MPLFADNLTDVADILNSSVTDGVVRLTIGDSRDDKAVAADASMWSMDGFFSRPKPPDSTGSSEAIYIVDGDDKIVIATRDNRFADLVGTLNPGDRAIVAGDARIFVKEDGSITLYTVSQPDDDNMLLHMSGKDGKFILAIGTARIVITNDRIEFATNDASLVLDADGISVAGKHCAFLTGSGQLGAGALLPPAPLVPPAPLSSILKGPTGMAGSPSTSWTVAP